MGKVKLEQAKLLDFKKSRGINIGDVIVALMDLNVTSPPFQDNTGQFKTVDLIGMSRGSWCIVRGVLKNDFVQSDFKASGILMTWHAADPKLFHVIKAEEVHPNPVKRTVEMIEREISKLFSVAPGNESKVH